MEKSNNILQFVQQNNSYIVMDSKAELCENLAESSQEQKPKKTKNTFFQNIIQVIRDILFIPVSFFVGLFFIAYVAAIGIVVGDSMNDTYYDGQRFIINKISYLISEPERFDVAIIEIDNGFIIKRIIGLPNETIQIDASGNILINGEILEENYGKEIIQYLGRAENEIRLGENEYFVMGDNRNASMDSRSESIGNIQREQLIGKLAFVIDLPFSK